MSNDDKYVTSSAKRLERILDEFDATEDLWREIELEKEKWTVTYFKVKKFKDNQIINTAHMGKVKVVPGKCQDCFFRVSRGMTYCDCQDEVPKEYLVKGSMCNLSERKFIKVKADKGI